MASPLPPENFGPDLEQLGNIGGLRTAREDFVPNIQSAYGSIIQNAPDYQYFTAPLSNQGRSTATYGGQNNLVVAPNTPIRVVNNATGEVVYTGTGYEGAQAAIDAAKSLSSSAGKKANWDIQVTRPGGTGFESVSTDRPDTSALDVAAKVAGTALPIAVGFIPGFGQLATGLQIAAGAGAGAAGAGLRGDNILKGALMGGLSSAGGTLVGDALRGATNLSANAARAIGTGIGTTAGGVVTGQGLENSLLSGIASGGLSYLGGEAFGKRGGTTSGTSGSNIGSSGVELGDIVVTGGIPRFSGAVFTPSFADKAQLRSDQADPYGTGNFAVQAPAATGLTQDEILVNALRNTGSSNFSVGAPRTRADFSVPEEIIVEAQKNADTGTSTFAVPSTVSDSGLTKDEIEVMAKKGTDTGSSTAAVGGPYIDPEFGNDIEVTAKKTDAKETGTSLVPTNLLDQIVDADVKKDLEKGKADDAKKKMDVADYLRLLGLGVGLVGSLGGGGKGSGSAGKYTSRSNLPSTFSAKLPTPGQGGAFTVGGLGPRVSGAGGTFSARPVTDWYRYGMGRAMDIPEGMDLSGATSPYAGYGPGTLGEETFRRITAGAPAPFAARREPLPNMISSLGRNATLPQIETALAGAKTAEEARQINPGTVYFNIDAATANALGDPSLVGTVMSIQDLQRRMAARPMSHGGSMGYARGSSRESFAVEGPGTGRSDDIPAVLSDGEYVIDAETVALLGDGSSKAGAKKLDEMRVKIRKAKGKNLAKGKFSVNAKRPEAYMSGGRI